MFVTNWISTTKIQKYRRLPTFLGTISYPELRSFLNQLGINPAFNLLTSALDDMRKENKELHLMPYAEAITNTRQ